MLKIFSSEIITFDWSDFPLEEFFKGIKTELKEHGNSDAETNVIGNDLEKAGKIAWAHLKEMPDYYTQLKKMEN